MDVAKSFVHRLPRKRNSTWQPLQAIRGPAGSRQSNRPTVRTSG
jgi:hypothetical protein